MRTAGIICEYDPFHKGHLRQLTLLRERGIEAVVCLMSGNTTQRGVFACADKYTRANAALMSGADLVLELPYPYSSASAEYFAAAGVCILDAFGVDEINFGSESGDYALLEDAAGVISDKGFLTEYRRILEEKPAFGSAAAFAEAFLQIHGKELPGGSNDLLAISYIRAAMLAHAQVRLTVTKRIGAGYNDDTDNTQEYPSATGIRKLLAGKRFGEAYSRMPEGAVEVYREAESQGSFPTQISRLDSAVLSFFRLCNPVTLENIAEAGGGVIQRLASAAKTAATVDEMFRSAATKRYTTARLQRAALFSMTGVEISDLRTSPVYTTLLAANRRGRELLASDRQRGIGIVTKPADAPVCRQSELSRRLDSLFTLTLPKAKPAEAFFRCSPKISEND